VEYEADAQAARPRCTPAGAPIPDGVTPEMLQTLRGMLQTQRMAELSGGKPSK